ncbi:MAG: hypothetical protein ACR2MX_18040 [Cyclobacteriaceae bacterium]
MALSAKVKINRINNLSDARYTAGMGVEWAGFCLDPNDPECLDRETYSAMTGWISGVKLVGEFGNCDYQNIAVRLAECPVDYVQTSNKETVNELKERDLKVIFEVEVSDKLETTLREAKDNIAYFLINKSDAELHNSGLKDILILSNQYPIILGFGFDAVNVTSITRSHPIKGIALDGGKEIKPGIKDFDHLADIFDALEIED